MKKLVQIFTLVISLGVMFTSCKKEPITPGNYPPNQASQSSTSNWQNQYTNGGVINTGTNPTNELVGTTWVLVEFKQLGYSTYYPKDTIRFIDNTHYTIQNGTQKTYSLSSGVASTNKTLTFNFFYPFGGSHYSGEVGGTFVSDGIIVSAKFKNIQNTTPDILATFKKI